MLPTIQVGQKRSASDVFPDENSRTCAVIKREISRCQVVVKQPDMDRPFPTEDVRPSKSCG